MSLLEGTTLVAGGFIVGAVITPDMTRFNRSAADVVKPFKDLHPPARTGQVRRSD
jgi:purine-cytosine permease-like protein